MYTDGTLTTPVDMEKAFVAWTGESWSQSPGFVGEVMAQKEHIDGFGHVNNLIYPTWALDAAWHHSAKLGYPFERFRELGTGFVVWHHEFDYVVPVVEGDRVYVATWIAKNDGRLRLTRAYEMRLAESGKLLFQGHTLFISIDMKTGRPVRMPQAYAAAYKAVVNESEV